MTLIAKPKNVTVFCSKLSKQFIHIVFLQMQQSMIIIFLDSVINTGCFFSNDTVCEDIAQPVLHLKTFTMGQIKGIICGFVCCLPKYSIYMYNPVLSLRKSTPFCISDEKNHFFNKQV